MTTQANLLDQILSGENRQLQLLAASGLVPLAPEELLPIQVALAGSPDGEIAGTQEGREVYEVFIPDGIFLNTNITADPPSVSKSITFYNPVRDKIFFISVGQEGDHWILSRDVGSEVLASEPHPLPDGRELTIRFTTLEKTADFRKILMERSWDGGATWEKGFYQYMTRTRDGTENAE